MIGWIREVVMDCAEPWALARFWAGLLGGTPVEWYPGWVTLEPPPHGQRLSFQASTAPPGAGAARVHFDVLVGDLAAAHDRVVAAGAVFIPRACVPAAGAGRGTGRLAGLPGPGRAPVLPGPAVTPAACAGRLDGLRDGRAGYVVVQDLARTAE